MDTPDVTITISGMFMEYMDETPLMKNWDTEEPLVKAVQSSLLEAEWNSNTAGTWLVATLPLEGLNLLQTYAEECRRVSSPIRENGRYKASRRLLERISTIMKENGWHPEFAVNNVVWKP